MPMVKLFDKKRSIKDYVIVQFVVKIKIEILGRYYFDAFKYK